MKALLLSPEPPYPLHGGGAYRTASLLHYLARIATVDLILISESGKPALLPPNLVRKQLVIPLAASSRTAASRYLRNVRRAILGVPPLIDRLSGLESKILAALGTERYDIGIIEHFWCAPYIAQIASACDKTVLDLHNIESMLHQRSALLSPLLIGAGHRRFAAASRILESALLPRFSLVLATSEPDAAAARALAPAAHVCVYPNSLPLTDAPNLAEQPRIVFSANFEYHPNIDAVQVLIREIWPEVRRRNPTHQLRLVGRGDACIRHLLPADPVAAGIQTTGPIPDALAEIAQAAVVGAPLRSGSGTRLKISEAWAAARPVVATPLAAEGLDARHGENIILASSPTDFAAAINALLDQPAERKRLGSNGRRTFEHLYTWNAAWEKLDLDLRLTRTSELTGYTGIA